MAHTSKEFENAFYGQRRSDWCPYVINDPVKILKGDHVGKSGSVISYNWTDGSPLYIVELGDSGLDVRLDSNDFEPLT